MLLQIRVVPPPDVFTPFVALGRGLGQLFNPRGAQRQAFLDLLAANPDILEKFKEAQDQAETQAARLVPTIEEAREAADITGPAPIAAERFRPNVLEAFGFDLAETESILQAAPETPEARARAAELAAGLPEARVELETLSIEAQLREARLFLSTGIPELRVAILANTTSVEAAMAEFRKKEVKLFEEAIGRLSTVERDLLDFSLFAPGFAENRVRLSIAAAQLALRSAGSPFEIAQAQFDLAAAYDEQIIKIIKEAREAKTDDEIRLAVQRLNEFAEARLRDVPNARFTILSSEDEKFLRRNGINLRIFRTPSLTEVQNRILQGLQDESVPLLAAGESEGAIVGRIRADPRTGGLWEGLTDDDKELWLTQLRERARVEQAETGPPLSAEEVLALGEQARDILRSPTLTRDVAIILLTLGKIGQGLGAIKRAIGNVIGKSLEEIQTAKELVEFLSSPEGQAALKEARRQKPLPTPLTPTESQ